ncbi:hypothetical protein P7C70_g3382, partial [Phenoliferia sp. Uapishka_3]
MEEKPFANQYGDICASCSKQLGKGTGRKLLKCSQCLHSHYCSQECQLEHWPLHKALCRRWQKLDQEAEENALATPIEAVAFENIEKYLPQVYHEVALTARTPLRIGRPDALNSNSALQLHFTYDHTPDLLPRKFTLDDGFVVPFSTLYATPAIYHRMTQFKENAKAHMAPGDLAIITVSHVKYRPDPRHQPDLWRARAIFQPNIIPVAKLSNFAPIETRKLLPDWLGYLKKRLAVDKIEESHEASAIWELYESEGDDVASQLVAAKARGVESARALVEKGRQDQLARGEK